MLSILIQTEFSIKIFQIILILDSLWLILNENSILGNPSLYQFCLIRIENLVRTGLGSFALMPWIELDLFALIFDRFSSDEIQNVIRISSEWFALVRIQILE